MRERGFSVIEVMIAAGVLAVVVALVLPAALGRFAERSLDGVARDVSAAIALARSGTSESGLPVAVRFRLDTPSGAWRIESARMSEGDSPERLDGLSTRAASAERGADRADAEPDWRVLRTLPRGVEVLREAPEPSDVPPMPPVPAAAPLADAGETPETILVGIFLPGGRCAVGGGFFLVRAQGTAPETITSGVELNVSAWTGRVRAEPWRALSPADDLMSVPTPESLPTDWLAPPTDAGGAP